MRRRLQLRRPRESGIHMSQRPEGPDHQAGANQQDQRKRHLHHHQKNSARGAVVCST
jgi:hypothetical protein